MSGIAITAPTTPGSVATCRSCSSERSSAISSRISSSAKIRAGTRISARAEAGISQVVSSIRTSKDFSDIEHHPAAPGSVLPPEAEPVQRHRLHERARLAAAAVYEALDTRSGDGNVRALGDEAFRLGEEDELVQPRGEERREVGRLEVDPPFDGLTPRRPGQLAEGAKRLPEGSFCRVGLELELELGRVLDEAVHGLSTVAPKRLGDARTTPHVPSADLRLSMRSPHVRLMQRALGSLEWVTPSRSVESPASESGSTGAGRSSSRSSRGRSLQTSFLRRTRISR